MHTILILLLSLCLMLPAAGEITPCQTLHVGEGQAFKTISAALKKMDRDQPAEIILHGGITEKKKLVLEQLHLTLRAQEDATLQLTYPIRCTGGSFTLGGGGQLSIMGAIICEDLDFTGESGVTVSAEGSAVTLKNCTFSILGGTYTGRTGLEMENCTGSIYDGQFSGDTGLYADICTFREIRGGTFLSPTSQAVLISSTVIERITGGHFEKTEESVSGSRAAFYADHESRIGQITGGSFRAASGAGLQLIRGSSIGEISGGTFVSLSTNPRMEFCHHGLAVLAGGDGFETGIHQISGGTFESHGREQGYGMFVYCNSSGRVYIDSISDGVFYGSSGLVMGNANSQGSAGIGEISGGWFEAAGVEDSPAYPDAALALYGTVTGCISGGTFLSSRAFAPGILQDAYCFLDTQAFGPGGQIQAIKGGTVIARGNAPGLVNGEQTCGISEIRGGVFCGPCAVHHAGEAPLTISGGTFLGTDRACLDLVNPRSVLVLEPELSGTENLTEGDACFWVLDYLMDGVQNKYLFRCAIPDSVRYPETVIIDESGKRHRYVYRLSGQSTPMQHPDAWTGSLSFRYFIPQEETGD